MAEVVILQKHLVWHVLGRAPVWDATRIWVLYQLVRGMNLPAIVLLISEKLDHLAGSLSICELDPQMLARFHIVSAYDQFLGDFLIQHLRDFALRAERHVLENDHKLVLDRG